MTKLWVTQVSESEYHITLTENNEIVTAQVLRSKNAVVTRYDEIVANLSADNVNFEQEIRL